MKHLLFLFGIATFAVAWAFVLYRGAILSESGGSWEQTESALSSTAWARNAAIASLAVSAVLLALWARLRGRNLSRFIGCLSWVCTALAVVFALVVWPLTDYSLLWLGVAGFWIAAGVLVPWLASRP